MHVKRIKAGLGLRGLEIHVGEISIPSWCLIQPALNEPSHEACQAAVTPFPLFFFFENDVAPIHRMAVYFMSRLILTSHLSLVTHFFLVLITQRLHNLTIYYIIARERGACLFVEIK